MNNKEFIEALASRTGLTPASASRRTEQMIETLATLLDEGRAVNVAGFGAFEVKKLAERVIVNPANRKSMLVPPRLSLSFKLSAREKKRVNAQTPSTAEDEDELS